MKKRNKLLMTALALAGCSYAAEADNSLLPIGDDLMGYRFFMYQKDWSADNYESPLDDLVVDGVTYKYGESQSGSLSYSLSPLISWVRDDVSDFVVASLANSPTSDLGEESRSNNETCVIHRNYIDNSVGLVAKGITIGESEGVCGQYLYSGSGIYAVDTGEVIYEGCVTAGVGDKFVMYDADRIFTYNAESGVDSFLMAYEPFKCVANEGEFLVVLDGSNMVIDVESGFSYELPGELCGGRREDTYSAGAFQLPYSVEVVDDMLVLYKLTANGPEQVDSLYVGNGMELFRKNSGRMFVNRSLINNETGEEFLYAVDFSAERLIDRSDERFGELDFFYSDKDYVMALAANPEDSNLDQVILFFDPGSLELVSASYAPYRMNKPNGCVRVVRQG